MAVAPPEGRRERNKAAKLERIVAAASELFAERGVDDVTTQEIAEKADIGTGTLFLYARTKGELLLLVQNAHYEDALARGRRDAEGVEGALDAVLALLRPVIACNRVQVENGRTYLREMVFGDPSEPHHGRALAIAGETELAVAFLLTRGGAVGEEAAVLARVVSAVLFVTMAGAADAGLGVDEVAADLRRQLAVVLPG